jgi:hypothetical protein
VALCSQTIIGASAKRGANLVPTKHSFGCLLFSMLILPFWEEIRDLVEGKASTGPRAMWTCKRLGTP